MTELESVTADAVAVMLACLNEDHEGTIRLLAAHDATRLLLLVAFCARFAVRIAGQPDVVHGADVRAVLQRTALELSLG